MKIAKPFFRILLILFGFLVNVSPVLAAFEAYPAARSPLQLRDRYETDLFTGSAVYSYPIKVPKGTNDLTPAVSLTYNSLGARDLSISAGIGWQLNRDYIERDVNFTPANTGDDKFKLHFQGGVYDLVFVPTENRYHTKIESSLKIEKVAGAGNETGEYWQVTMPDGTTYRFGHTANSELLCSGHSYVRQWNVDEITDVHNNHIYFTYTENNGVSYLNHINYNNDQLREITFNYVVNAYQRSVYVHGCNLSETSRLGNIQVKTAATLVHQYDLGYSASLNGQPLLQSITEKGSDGSSLPPTTFEYKPEMHSWPSQYTSWESNNAFDANLADANVRISDVTGDGLPDVIKVTSSGGNNTYQVYKNTGTTWQDTPETWLNNNPMDARLDQYWTRLLDVDGDGLPDIVKATQDTWYVWKNTGSSWNTQSVTWAGNAQVPGFAQTDNHVALLDVTGDGLPDVVKSVAVSGPNDTWFVYKNTGTNFQTTPETWINNSPVDVTLAKENVTLSDVNGDGLLDIIKSHNNGGPNNDWRVFLNTGSNWNTTYQSWVNPIDAYLNFNPSVALGDVNGDGMSDIVRVVNNGGPNNDWRVWLSKGSSWNAQFASWVNPVDTNLAENNVKLADVNGDGLLDIVRSVNTGGPNLSRGHLM